MAEKIREHERVVVNTPGDTEAERIEEVTIDPYAERRATVYKMQQGVYLLFGIIEGLIAIRFVLRLLGANPGAAFASLIYGLTDIFIAPFVGLFGTPQFNGSAFEIHSLIAMVIYALLAWVVVKLVWLLFGETRRGVRTKRIDTRYK